MTFIVTRACIDVLDRACVDVCPVDCLYEGDRMMYIHPDECVDCGACEPVCPQEAIFYEDELPDDLTEYADINREFFAELGAPGGAKQVGKQSFDSPRLLTILSA